MPPIRDQSDALKCNRSVEEASSTEQSAINVNQHDLTSEKLISRVMCTIPDSSVVSQKSEDLEDPVLKEPEVISVEDNCTLIGNRCLSTVKDAELQNIKDEGKLSAQVKLGNETTTSECPGIRSNATITSSMEEVQQFKDNQVDRQKVTDGTVSESANADSDVLLIEEPDSLFSGSTEDYCKDLSSQSVRSENVQHITMNCSGLISDEQPKATTGSSANDSAVDQSENGDISSSTEMAHSADNTLKRKVTSDSQKDKSVHTIQVPETSEDITEIQFCLSDIIEKIINQRITENKKTDTSKKVEDDYDVLIDDSPHDRENQNCENKLSGQNNAESRPDIIDVSDDEVMEIVDTNKGNKCTLELQCDDDVIIDNCNVSRNDEYIDIREFGKNVKEHRERLTTHDVIPGQPPSSILNTNNPYDETYVEIIDHPSMMTSPVNSGTIPVIVSQAISTPLPSGYSSKHISNLDVFVHSHGPAVHSEPFDISCMASATGENFSSKGYSRQDLTNFATSLKELKIPLRRCDDEHRLPNNTESVDCLNEATYNEDLTKSQDGTSTRNYSQCGNNEEHVFGQPFIKELSFSALCTKTDEQNTSSLPTEVLHDSSFTRTRTSSTFIDSSVLIDSSIRKEITVESNHNLMSALPQSKPTDTSDNIISAKQATKRNLKRSKSNNSRKKSPSKPPLSATTLVNAVSPEDSSNSHEKNLNILTDTNCDSSLNPSLNMEDNSKHEQLTITSKHSEGPDKMCDGIESSENESFFVNSFSSDESNMDFSDSEVQDKTDSTSVVTAWDSVSERISEKISKTSEPAVLNIGNKHTVLKRSNRYKFECFLCDKKYRERHELRKHFTIHIRKVIKSEAKKFQCIFCEKPLHSKEALKHHIQKKHSISENAKYACQHCTAFFTKASDLDKHVEVQHSSEPAYTNGVSSRREKKRKVSSSSSDEVQEDIPEVASVRKNSKSPAADVPRVTRNAKRLRSDTSSSTSSSQVTKPKPRDEDIDSLVESTKSTRSSSHSKNGETQGLQKSPVDSVGTKEKVNTKNYLCTVCNTYFSTQALLTRHSREIHPSTGSRRTSDKYHCKTCNMKFSTSPALASHVKFNHASEKNAYPCELCSLKFPMASYLDQHYRVAHGKWVDTSKNTVPSPTKTEPAPPPVKKATGGKSFSCPVCQYTVKDLASLVTHVQLNHERSG